MSKGKSSSQSKATHYDIAIVGGGVAGVYSGWRLMTASPGESPQLKKLAGKNGKLTVAVFEGTNRIGGRLLSARPPGFTDKTACEIGGMRFVSSQTLVANLVENELKLPYYKQIVDLDSNIMYLRGEQLRFQQKNDPLAMPYRLEWAEEQYILNNDPSGLIGWAISKMIPQVNTLEPDELRKFLRTVVIDGTPLYEHGFWNLLARTLSPDAYQVARTLVGYDCLGSNANAVDLISEYFDFTPTVEYYLFNQGYDTVPWELEKRFKQAGGEVIQNEWVSGFDSITLPNGETGVEIHFRGNKPSITAGAIILAMPRRSLELLQREGPVFGDQHAAHVQYMVSSVRAIPLYKLFLVYEYPWWQASGVSQGRSLTDTPVRQLYYWPVDPEAKTPAKLGKSLLMAYNDATNVDFWEGLSGAKTPAMHTRGAQQHFRKIPPGVRLFEAVPLAKLEAAPKDEYTRRLRDNWNEHRAPYEMVMEMHRQIKRMHNVQYAPRPTDAAYMDWSVDPYGGGVHFWNRGYKSWEILEQITQPVEDFPCYICGEAYSTNQTWAEGSLQTAEIVLQKHLGLKKPTWVKPNTKPSNPQPPPQQQQPVKAPGNAKAAKAK